MTDDRLFGETDLEEELKEKEEIIMSLRLNEHLLKDKLEIARRNLTQMLQQIEDLETRLNRYENMEKEYLELLNKKHKTIRVLTNHLLSDECNLTDNQIKKIKEELK